MVVVVVTFSCSDCALLTCVLLLYIEVAAGVVDVFIALVLSVFSRVSALCFMYLSVVLYRLTEAHCKFFDGEFSPGNSVFHFSCQLVGILL